MVVAIHSTVYHVLQAVIYYLLLALEIYIAIKTSKNSPKNMCVVLSHREKKDPIFLMLLLISSYIRIFMEMNVTER